MAAKKSKQKITACLWFDRNAEDAVKFYTSVFKKSKKGVVNYYGKNQPMPEGMVLTVRFEIEGQKFLALNGGPQFKFTEAISFIINCKTQNEIDFYWEKLSKGGTIQACGWLKDKYGVSWQVVPEKIDTWMSSKDSKKSARVMDAILKMRKLDIPSLEKAYKGN